jgi:hypothetical protein
VNFIRFRVLRQTFFSMSFNQPLIDPVKINESKSDESAIKSDLYESIDARDERVEHNAGMNSTFWRYLGLLLKIGPSVDVRYKFLRCMYACLFVCGIVMLCHVML